MLAKRRVLKVGESSEFRTPMLLPSFSSKGFPNVRETLKTMEEYIADEILVSAYDLHYKFIEGPFDFASLIYLDSGGYESSKDAELSETYELEHKPREWDVEKLQEILENWTSTSPTICVSFDHPKNRVSIPEQIERAKQLNLKHVNHGRALLLKPESEKSIRLDLKSILPHVKKMTGFSVIGVTEKEIGNSLLSRMVNIAKLRIALNEHHVDLPIHIFGSLDTIATYLYFLAGADIFDGLTWLRYAFSDGDTIYRHAYGMMKLPFTTNTDLVEARCWSNNYQYMQDMKLTMQRFIIDRDFSHFGKHAELIQRAYQDMNALLEGA